MEKEKILTVPYIDQTADWPTGCESVSAVMLAKYLGAKCSVDDFIEKYLEKHPMQNKEGRLYGPDPNRYFAGSPYDPDSFGCYPKVMVQALNRLFAREGMPYLAEDATGIPTEKLLREQIDAGMPVLYWTSINLKPTYVGPVWSLEDGNGDFTWVSNEHCLVLVGYGQKEGKALLYCNDPWENHGCIGYDRALVERRHAEQAQRAVLVREKK